MSTRDDLTAAIARYWAANGVSAVRACLFLRYVADGHTPERAAGMLAIPPRAVDALKAQDADFCDLLELAMDVSGQRVAVPVEPLPPPRPVRRRRELLIEAALTEEQIRRQREQRHADIAALAQKKRAA